MSAAALREKFRQLRNQQGDDAREAARVLAGFRDGMGHEDMAIEDLMEVASRAAEARGGPANAGTLLDLTRTWHLEVEPALLQFYVYEMLALPEPVLPRYTRRNGERSVEGHLAAACAAFPHELPTAHPFTARRLAALRVPQLREVAEWAGVPYEGTKAAVAARIMELQETGVLH